MGDEPRGATVKMKERWGEFARSDPMFYIAVRPQPWEREEFFASGRGVVEDVLAWARPDLGRERMLEIGCGLGRLLVHFAPHFDRVDGVDVAIEMIEQAEELGQPANVHLATTSGADLSPYENDSFDFVVSVAVFQHIPDEAVIGSYLAETERVLKPGARAVLHFDTRRYRPYERLAFALPDVLLPRTHRSFIRRYRRRPERLDELVGETGLSVTGDRGRGTGAHFLLLRKP